MPAPGVVVVTGGHASQRIRQRRHAPESVEVEVPPRLLQAGQAAEALRVPLVLGDLDVRVAELLDQRRLVVQVLAEALGADLEVAPAERVVREARRYRRARARLDELVASV